MPRFICLTTFLDGRDRFVKGETREHEKAAYFIEQGWAVAAGAAPSADVAMPDKPEAALDIHDVTHEQEAQNG